jgi:hypothetical protein
VPYDPIAGFVPESGQRLLNCLRTNLIFCQLGFAFTECLSRFPRRMPGLLRNRELSGRRWRFT